LPLTQLLTVELDLIANVGLINLFAKEIMSHVSAQELHLRQKPPQSLRQMTVVQRDLIASVGLQCPHAKVMMTSLAHVVHQKKKLPHQQQHQLP